MKQPKVSVIIPTHNRPGPLSRSVRSVLDQTFSDLELIIVDSSPNDESADIIRQFQDPRIRYIRTAKKNAAASRNIGIKNSGCEYIAFQDDDDIWMPDKLKKQMGLLCSSGIRTGIVYCSFWRLKGRAKTYFPFGSKNSPPEALSGNIHKKLLSGNFVSTQTALVKKECFEKCGMFDEAFPALEDWELWLRISEKYDFLFVNIPLVHVYHTAVSLSTDFEADIKARDLLLDKFKNEYLSDGTAGSNHDFYTGNLLFQTGRFSKSLTYLARALRASPRNLKIYPLLTAAFLLQPFGRNDRGTGPLIGIMVIRNENDILREVMDANVPHCDHIFVLDGTDDDPSLSKKICTSYPNVTYFTEDSLPQGYPKPIVDGCRQFLVEKARERYGNKGWFVLLHGDEIFVDAPSDIIRKYGKYFKCLTLDSPVFFIHKEQEPFVFDPEKALADQIFWYSGPGWPETRIFKNDPDINYDPNKHGVVPEGILLNYKTTFKIKHYTFRSPEQQIKRAKDRTEITKWQTGGYESVKKGAYYLDGSDFGKKFYRWISKQPLRPRINDPFIKRLFQDIFENFTRKRVL